MSETIHVFQHHAMATCFEVRLAGQSASYAAQAARTAFDVADHLEGLLSRFRENSEICQIGFLTPGERLRLSEPTFACLKIAKRMEEATERAFSITPDALKQQTELPVWTLDDATLSILCEAGRLHLDLGAIGKGFALDRMAEELAEWDCAAFLLIAGGSSILAGAPPPGLRGWSSGLGEADTDLRLSLSGCSLSGSGLAVQGEHIFDPRTGRSAERRSRVWALAQSAAESDALSTAAMVLKEADLKRLFGHSPDWLIFVNDSGKSWQYFGARPVARDQS